MPSIHMSLHNTSLMHGARKKRGRCCFQISLSIQGSCASHIHAHASGACALNQRLYPDRFKHSPDNAVFCSHIFFALSETETPDRNRKNTVWLVAWTILSILAEFFQTSLALGFTLWRLCDRVRLGDLLCSKTPSSDISAISKWSKRCSTFFGTMSVACQMHLAHYPELPSDRHASTTTFTSAANLRQIRA